ncbi:unnamed protein product, partial [Hapterophycus canaliculatus]
PKPRGVTQVNREAFASFPFDATASLIRRKGSKNRPSIGWELRSAEQLAASVARPDSAAAASTTAVISGGDGGGNDDDDARQPHLPAFGDRQLRSLHPSDNGAESWCDAGPPAEPAVGGREKVGWEECTAGCSPKGGKALTLLASPAGRGGMSLGGGEGMFQASKIVSSKKGTDAVEVVRAAGATAGAGSCIEDVVESGRAEPFLLDRLKGTPLPPRLLPGQGEQGVHESRELRPEEGVFGEQLDEDDITGGFPTQKRDFHSYHHRRRCHHHHNYNHHRHHHDRHYSQEMGQTSSWDWAASGRTDATILGSEDNDDIDNDNNHKANLRIVKAKAQESATDMLGSDGCAQSSTDDCCSETAHAGCMDCSEGKEGLERERNEAARVLLSCLEGGRATTPPGAVPSGGGGGKRLSDEPAVRVSELPDVCAICLGQYATGEEVHVLPCLHIFHAQCLDVWIVGHPSCPYCKGDLNVLPQESTPRAETSATALVRSVLSDVAAFFTRPLTRFREYLERRRQQRGRRQQEQQQQTEGQGARGDREGWDDDDGAGVIDFAVSQSVSTAAASPVVPMTVVEA